MKLFYRKNTPPLMLGVVGDSGCGKSTLVRGLHQIFGRGRVTEICLDDYHRYDRAERARRDLSALDPAANNLDLMIEHLQLLRQGKRILKPVYDHATGTFAHPEAVLPRPVIVVHGLFTLFKPELCQLFDLGIYLDPEESLRLEWKITRDTHKRGYKLEEVLRQIEERRPFARAYIEPQGANADLTISFRHAVSLLYRAEILDVRLAPHAAWHWPQLQPEGTTGWLALPPGRALHISGRIEQVAAERVAGAFVQTNRTHRLGPLFKSENLLKNLGLYNLQNASNLRQSLPLALTQILIAGRLLETLSDDDQTQVA